MKTNPYPSRHGIKIPLTADLLRKLVIYDPKTGAFTARVRLNQRIPAGWPLGYPKDGYLYVRLLGRHYRLHRLAWLYMTGEWPSILIDHFDSDGTNNRWRNLRPGNWSTNAQNQRKAHANSKTGVLGVCADGEKWRAQITVNKKKIYLGAFDTTTEAHEAYLAAKRKLHQGCTI